MDTIKIVTDGNTFRVKRPDGGTETYADIPAGRCAEQCIDFAHDRFEWADWHRHNGDDDLAEIAERAGKVEFAIAVAFAKLAGWPGI